MKSIIFFDFDGVIVNTLELSVKIFQQQDPTMTAERLRTWFEGNVLEGVRENNLSPRDFFEEYARRLPTIPPIAGIPAALSQLAEQYSLIIISSSLSTILDDYLQQHELRQFFTDVLGSDTAERKRDNFERALARHGAAAAECVFVTDTLGDILEAQALAIPTVAAAWGFHSKGVLQKGDPKFFAASPAELSHLLAELPR